MKQIKHIISILAVNSVILIAGILIIELVFGGWLNPNRLNRLNLVRDRMIEFNVSSIYKTSNPVIKYSRDKYGLRGNYSDPAGIDILTVGGSTTDQGYIRDGETWQDVLQQQFKSKGITVEIANAGVDGQSTVGHIKNFQWWFPNIPDLAPSFIIFYAGLNDFYIEGRNDYDDLLGDYRGQKSSIRKAISNNSAVWHLIRTLSGAYKAMMILKIGHTPVDFRKLRWKSEALQDDYEFMRPRLNGYADRLRILADMALGFGAKPVFITQPSRRYRVTAAGIEGVEDTFSYDGRQCNGVDFYHMMRRFDSVMKEVAIEKNIYFVDMAAYTDWNDNDYYDLAHMTPQGAEKVGTFLYDAIKEIISEAGLHSKQKE